MPSTSIGSAWKRSSLKKWKFWKSWLLAFNINFSHDGSVRKGPTKLWCCYHDRTTCSIKKIGPRPNSLAKLRPNGPVPTWKDRVPTWADCTVLYTFDDLPWGLGIWVRKPVSFCLANRAVNFTICHILTNFIKYKYKKMSIQNPSLWHLFNCQQL